MQTFHPLVSIVIPVYNGSNYMREAIDSALNQTYDNIEVIVVNDGSKDNTDEIAKSYGDKIRYFSKENGGVSTALNLAIKNAKGEYISWLSHDDVYYLDKIEKQIDQLKGVSDKQVIIYGKYSCVDEKGDFLYEVDLPKQHGLMNLFKGMYAVANGCLHGCTLLVPKNLFSLHGYFNEALSCTQDYDLWFRFFNAKSVGIYYVDECFVKSRVHSSQTSKISDKVLIEGNNLWRRIAEEADLNEIEKTFGKRSVFLKNLLKLAIENNYIDTASFLEISIKNERLQLLKNTEENPLVSIVIPCFNQGKYLLEAINSSLNQSYKNIEVIVINDGSKDNTDEIAKSYGNKIRYYSLENGGVNKVRNIGISEAKGVFIQFLDADDILLEEKISKQIEFFKDNPEVDIHYCGFRYSYESEHINSSNQEVPNPESLKLNTVSAYEDFLFRWQRPLSIPIHCFLFRKNIFEDIKFNESFQVGEDWIMWIFLAKNRRIFSFSDFIGVVYRIHTSNVTQRKAHSFFHVLLAIAYIREHLVEGILLQKFDDLTVDYVSYLKEILLQESCKKSVDLNVLNTDEVKGEKKDNINASFGFLLKIKAKVLFKKVFQTISPTFRMLQGNKHRVNKILEGIAHLEWLNKSMNQDILGKVNNREKIDNERFDILLNKISDVSADLVEIRREYNFNALDKSINILGNKVYIADNHRSEIKRYRYDILEFFREMEKYILKTDTIVDIGCGIRPQTFFTPKVHICVEPFKQYRDVVKPFFPNKSHFIFLKEGAIDALQVMDDNSIDTVFMVDIIEHLEKEEGLKLLQEADRVARKQIIVFTPLGFYPMHFHEDGQKDAWGLNGNDVQEHKSGWLPEDFGNTWDFYICEDCHEAFLPEEKAAGKKYSALMAIKTKNFHGFPVNDETPDFVKQVYEERILK